MLSKITLRNHTHKRREAKLNISLRALKLKSNAGRQGRNIHRQPFRISALDTCWIAKLHTPKPATAKETPIVPDSTPAIKLILVWVLKLICLFSMTFWIRPKELMTMVNDRARVKGIRVGCLKNVAIQGAARLNRLVTTNPTA